jgi:serine acetyltransferase
MGGGVQIGNFSTISIGATVKHLIKIGDDVVVGANSLVLENLPNNIVAYGLPAKKIRERKREDKYL